MFMVSLFGIVSGAVDDCAAFNASGAVVDLRTDRQISRRDKKRDSPNLPELHANTPARNATHRNHTAPIATP